MTDNKPLTTIKLTTNQPCLNPFEVPFDENKPYMHAEMGVGVNGCKPMVNVEDDEEPITTDSRYTKFGLQGITQFELEKQSGVLDILENYNFYTYSVFPGSSLKHQVSYDVFTRPTIDWSL